MELITLLVLKSRKSGKLRYPACTDSSLHVHVRKVAGHRRKQNQKSVSQNQFSVIVVSNYTNIVEKTA